MKKVLNKNMVKVLICTIILLTETFQCIEMEKVVIKTDNKTADPKNIKNIKNEKNEKNLGELIQKIGKMNTNFNFINDNFKFDSSHIEDLNHRFKIFSKYKLKIHKKKIYYNLNNRIEYQLKENELKEDQNKNLEERNRILIKDNQNLKEELSNNLKKNERFYFLQQ